jgi:hypothetical protein
MNKNHFVLLLLVFQIFSAESFAQNLQTQPSEKPFLPLKKQMLFQTPVRDTKIRISTGSGLFQQQKSCLPEHGHSTTMNSE